MKRMVVQLQPMFVVIQDIASPTAVAGDDGWITCLNTSYALDGSNSTGDNLTFAWYDSFGDLVSSSSSFTTTEIGDYSLVVTNTINGCSDIDEVSVF